MNIKKEIDRAMTVGQLKEMLEKFDDSMPIFYFYPSHDYWHTQLASSIQEVSLGEIKWSDYHNSPEIVDNKEDDRYNEDLEKVVLIV